MSRWRGITAWRPGILIEAPEVTSPSDEVPDGVNGLWPKLRPLDRSVDPIDDSQQDFFANGPLLAGLIQRALPRAQSYPNLSQNSSYVHTKTGRPGPNKFDLKGQNR
jgi:hypothetical protein